MHTWQTLLPTMGLKSHDFATNVYVPEKGNRFVEYCRSHGRDLSEPIPFTLFAEYGWTRLDDFHRGHPLILSDRAWRFGVSVEF